MAIAMGDRRVFSKTPKGTAELAARSGALSLAQRRLLILVDGLRDVDELSTQETAEALGISSLSVRVRLSLARKKIRARILEKHPHLAEGRS